MLFYLLHLGFDVKDGDDSTKLRLIVDKQSDKQRYLDLFGIYKKTMFKTVCQGVDLSEDDLSE